MTRTRGSLWQCLVLAIVVQVVVGLILVGSTLLASDNIAEQDTPLRYNRVINEPSEILVADRPRSNNRQPQNIPPEPTNTVVSKVETKNEAVVSKPKEVPDFSQFKPIQLVQWSGGRGEGAAKCDVPCFHSSDRSDNSINSADAIIFSIPSFGGSPRSALGNKGAQAKTVAISMESSEYYRRQKDLSDYDLTITCSFDSDLPVTYYGWNYNLLKDVSEWPWERREPAILFVARNCHSRNRRETLVKLLQKYTRVDSVSSCMNNHPWPADLQRSQKDDLQMRYMMYLAAENSIEKDYVTEKVYGGLINGAVPVYLGSPTIEEFVPSHSVIKVPKDFTEADVMKIAEEANRIFTNKSYYESWIEFKNHPYEEHFNRKMHIAHTHIWCRLCRKLFSMKYGYGWNKERQELVFE